MARVTSSSVAAGATLNQDVQLGGNEWLTVIAVVGTSGNAAGAAGDVSVNVLPYLDDAAPGSSTGTLSPLTLGTADTVAATLSSSRAYILARYRVAGLRRVQIQAKNNNAGAKPVEINFDLG